MERSGHALPTLNLCLPRHSTFVISGSGLNKVNDPLTKMWFHSINSMMLGLSHVFLCRLPYCSFWNYRGQRLKALGGMTYNQLLWHKTSILCLLFDVEYRNCPIHFTR